MKIDVKVSDIGHSSGFFVRVLLQNRKTVSPKMAPGCGLIDQNRHEVELFLQ